MVLSMRLTEQPVSIVIKTNFDNASQIHALATKSLRNIPNFSPPDPRSEGRDSRLFFDFRGSRVMRAAVSIPVVASASVLHSTAVNGSVVGVVRPL